MKSSQDDRVRRKLEALEAACRREGIPVTPQRRAVLVAVAGRDDHPTADEVFGDVDIAMPGVARATVYRVLDALVALGVARRTDHPGAAARFDARTDRHHHLVCRSCGRMDDLDDGALDRLPLPDERRTGFAIDDYSVHFRGLCPDCRRAEKETPNRKGGTKA